MRKSSATCFGRKQLVVLAKEPTRDRDVLAGDPDVVGKRYGLARGAKTVQRKKPGETQRGSARRRRHVSARASGLDTSSCARGCKTIGVLLVELRHGDVLFSAAQYERAISFDF